VLASFDVSGAWIVGLLTSASNIGAVFASAVLFFIGDEVGRKAEMLAAAFLCAHDPTQPLRTRFFSFVHSASERGYRAGRDDAGISWGRCGVPSHRWRRSASCGCARADSFTA
jgi:MFS family permease